jgi:hypothetical protein
MALQTDTTTIYGFNVASAYHRVDNISIVNKNKMSFHLYAFADVNKPFFSERTFEMVYDLTGENPIKQAYLHLKTLPEFLNATDC